MKLIISKEYSTGYDEWWCRWFECPNCKENGITYGFDFCPRCGRELEWACKEVKQKRDMKCVNKGEKEYG